MCLPRSAPAGAVNTISTEEASLDLVSSTPQVCATTSVTSRSTLLDPFRLCKRMPGERDPAGDAGCPQPQGTPSTFAPLQRDGADEEVDRRAAADRNEGDLVKLCPCLPSRVHVQAFVVKRSCWITSYTYCTFAISQEDRSAATRNVLCSTPAW